MNISLIKGRHHCRMKAFAFQHNREGSLSCLTCSDTGPRFIRFPLQSRPVLSPLRTIQRYWELNLAWIKPILAQCKVCWIVIISLSIRNNLLHNLYKFVMIKTKWRIVLLKPFKLFVFVPLSPYWFFFSPSFMVAVINGNDQTRLLRNAWW